jgi:two-component system, LuxR family, sensor kinase FixL
MSTTADPCSSPAVAATRRPPKLQKVHGEAMGLLSRLRLHEAVVFPGYVALYLLLDYISFIHEFSTLGITLWNPPPALSLALLLRYGARYAPLLFVAVLLDGEVFRTAPETWFAKVLTSAALAGGYTVLALLLHVLRRQTEGRVLAQAVHILLVIPLGVLIIGIIYCGTFVLTNALPTSQYAAAVGYFWIGDTIGIVTLLPALLAAQTIYARHVRALDGATLRDAGIFVLGVCLALAVIFGGNSPTEFQFFYLLFLPVIWIAARQGYAGAAFSSAFVHASLILVVVRLGYGDNEFMTFQLLMLALSATGLLLGAAITERELSERRIRTQQAELERMSRIAAVIGTGAALAHQISQPLSTAATYVYVGRRQLAAPQPNLQAVDQSLVKALLEAKRARQILEHVRDFISVGRLRSGPVSVAAVCDKLGAAWRSEATERGVSIRLEIAPAPMVHADATQVEQVLINLVSNALEAASERPGGAVVIRVYEAERRVRIEVEDNGPGVSSDIAERLFEPFVTSKPRGMGLGVALSRRIIDAHGGKLWYEPVEPQGSRFLVDL